MNDYIYMGIIVAMFVIFIILHIKQNNKIKRLMNRYEKFMKGKIFSKWINWKYHIRKMN